MDEYEVNQRLRRLEQKRQTQTPNNINGRVDVRLLRRY
jgi:hypothetical protein